MGRQLGGKETVGRRVRRQEAQGRDTARLRSRKALLHHDLFARFMRCGAEAEAWRVLPQFDRPAGQHLGESGDVGLGVAGQRADGVQLHALAGQILIQAAVAALAGGTVRTDRSGVVQIQ
jgi:hypothetical protein